MRYSLYFLAIFISIAVFAMGCDKPSQPTEPPTTQPPPTPNNSIKFAVIGDFGKDTDNTFLVSEMVKSWNVDFIITVGDNTYTQGGAEIYDEVVGQFYCDFVYNNDAPTAYRCTGKAAQDKVNRFFPSLGNHDYYTTNNNVPYLDYFSLPNNEEFYDFYGINAQGDTLIQLFALNTGKNGDLAYTESDQHQWLKDKSARSSIKFKVAYFHESPYTTGSHDSNENMQWDYKNLGMDAVFSGHDHIYQRIIDNTNDFPYFVCGISGKDKHDCFEREIDQSRFDVTCYDGDFGAMLVTVNPDEIRTEFYSVKQPNTPIDIYIIK